MEVARVELRPDIIQVGAFTMNLAELGAADARERRARRASDDQVHGVRSTVGMIEDFVEERVRFELHDVAGLAVLLPRLRLVLVKVPRERMGSVSILFYSAKRDATRAVEAQSQAATTREEVDDAR